MASHQPSATQDVERGTDAAQPLLEPEAVIVVAQGAVPGEHWTRGLARKTTACTSNLGTSLLFGLITAFGLKTIGQSVAIALVLLFIGFQVLAYYGFVNFRWSSVSGAVARQLDFNGDGKLTLADAGVVCKQFGIWALSWGFASTCGFLLGFWIGWRIL